MHKGDNAMKLDNEPSVLPVHTVSGTVKRDSYLGGVAVVQRAADLDWLGPGGAARGGGYVAVLGLRGAIAHGHIVVADAFVGGRADAQFEGVEVCMQSRGNNGPTSGCYMVRLYRIDTIYA